MKNLEIIQALIGDKADIPEQTLRVACIVSGINPDADYSSDMKCKVYSVALSQVSQARGIKSESEGDYSITYDTKDTAQMLKSMAIDSECDELIKRYNPKPTVSTIKW